MKAKGVFSHWVSGSQTIVEMAPSFDKALGCNLIFPTSYPAPAEKDLGCGCGSEKGPASEGASNSSIAQFPPTAREAQPANRAGKRSGLDEDSMGHG